MGPVDIIIAINQQRGLMSRHDVAHAPQLALVYPFGFLVQGCIKALAVEGIADGHKVWMTLCIRCSQVCNLVRLHECNLLFCKGSASGHTYSLLFSYFLDDIFLCQ